MYSMPQKYGHMEMFFTAHLCASVFSASFQGHLSCLH
jgi:hypothetical protein